MPSSTFLIKPASSLCNMRCEYCFYNNETKNRTVKSYGIMTYIVTEALIKRAYDYADELCSFVFQGGEPTLAGLKYFQDFLILAKNYNRNNVPTTYSIQTNGFDVSEEMAKFFSENKFLVGLSIDGYRQLHEAMRHDSFERVMKTANLFDKYKVEYNVLCVVNNYVARHGAKVYNFFKKCGFKYLQFIQCIDGFGEVREFSLTAKRYADFLKTTFDLYYNDFMNGNYVSIRSFDNYINILCNRPAECCGMQGECNCNFTIEGDGSVFPCDFYVLDEWKIGNVIDNSFSEMKVSENTINFIDTSKYIDPKCRQCHYFSLCRGGCRRLREPFHSNLPSLNKYCESYRDFFDYALEKMERIKQHL